MNKEYDVIIVGAGIAGTVMAAKLYKDYKILLVDKNTLPQKKVCGDLYVPMIHDLINAWNPPEDLFFQVKLKFHEPHLNLKSQKDIVLLSTKRENMSSFLLNRLGNNVEVRSACCIKKIEQHKNKYEVTSHDDHVFSARYLIGADGANSIIREFIGYKKASQVKTIQLIVEGELKEKDSAYFVFDEKYTDHYIWIIPTKEGIKTGSSLKNNDFDVLLDYVKDYAVNGVGKILKRETFPLTCLESAGEIKYGKNNCFLIGEAMGLVCPITGEGITSSIFTALTAAGMINEAKTITDYEKKCRKLAVKIKKDIFNKRLLKNKYLRKSLLKKLIN